VDGAAGSLSTRLHACVVLSLLVGIRTEEARALRWDHVVIWVDDSAGSQPITTAGFDPAQAGEDRYAIYVWRSERHGGGLSSPGEPALVEHQVPQADRDAEDEQGGVAATGAIPPVPSCSFTRALSTGSNACTRTSQSRNQPRIMFTGINITHRHHADVLPFVTGNTR